MKKKNLPTTITEISTIYLIAILIFIGIITSFTHQTWFETVYVVEDGLIESITVVGLLAISVLMFYRYFRLRKQKGRLFRMVLLATALLGIFGAGEEISWGQRIFDIESTEFFQQHNAQQETNLHNMVINGQKVNKLIFSKLLFAGIVSYLLLVPLFYHRSAAFRKLADSTIGIPVARLYQVILIGSILILTALSPSSKRDELNEFGLSFAFLLIFMYPQNKAMYANTVAYKGRPVQVEEEPVERELSEAC
ncbi:hypothetical protein ACMA1I_18795 [Pontibacter sp. 13R65]|uniref:hypothetical protein n=1 Tax=Pontibacter sp. 13R65 TaxID=3127458 RepID=UPI00301BF845